jgi:hypothetical protein
MAADAELFEIRAEEAAATLWAEADARARAEVVAWLVPQLTDAYRGAVLRWLVGQSAAAGGEDLGARAWQVPRDGEREGTYVYGITEVGPQEDESGGVSGIEGSAVSMVVEGPLAALSSTVRLAGFQAAQESPDVSEHSWLATAIRAHEDVVEYACRGMTVLPMRFGTVYPGASEVASFLAEHADALTDELHRLRGCTEWGAKLHIDRDAAFRGARRQDAELDAAAEEAAAASEGTAWMLRRQLAARTYHTVGKQVHACAEAVHDALASCALDSVVSRRGNGDDPGGLVLNGSYLVNDPDKLLGCADELRARFREDGIQLQITGPWPAYHFVRLPELGGNDD